MYMKYLEKSLRELFPNISELSASYQQPAICPHCGIHCDAHVIDKVNFDKKDFQFVFLIFQCTACDKIFTATYRVKEQRSEICGITPNVISSYSDELISGISPRFISLYNQALRSKDNKDFDLAAIGYRSAIEVLIKDYAINELNKDENEVSKKKLHDAISEYLPGSDFMNSADVIRYIGNDYTHYDRKYSDLDFGILDTYMDIFIGLIRTKLLINHPPVSRSHKA